MKYKFTQDWFSKNIDRWDKLFSPIKGRPNLHFLEIGAFEGRSAIWLLENVLTHESSDIIVVDTFQGSQEYQSDIDMKKVRELYYKNTKPFGNKVQTVEQPSQEFLRTLGYKPRFDFIYIDGGHKSEEVLEDAILAFRLLQPGGVMIFDDYKWVVMPEELDNPRVGINAFITCFCRQLTISNVGYQMTITKIPPVRKSNKVLTKKDFKEDDYAEEVTEDEKRT